jgi:hypothetical protein
MTVLLGAGLLFFTSCAGSQVKNMQPPATVSNPDPVVDPPIKQVAAADPAVPQSNKDSVQFLPSSSTAPRTKVHALPVVLAAPAAIAVNDYPHSSGFQPGVPLAANLQQVSRPYGSDWPWLLLLLLLLLMLAQQVWSRYQREKEALALNADLEKKGILARVARLAHERYLAKRSRLAHLAKLAKEAELAHEAKLAKAAGLVRKGIRAKLALVAHQLMLAKRARLARRAKRAKEALAAHEAKLDRDKARAHQAKLAREARLARKAKSANDAALAGPGVVAKGAGKSEAPGLAKSAPSINEGIGALGSEFSHPEVFTKAAGWGPETVLTKDALSTGKRGFTQASEPGLPGASKKEIHPVNREAAVEIPGMGQEAVLLKGVGLARPGVLGKTVNLSGDEILVQGPGMTEMVTVTIKRGATYEEIIVSVAKMGNFPAKKAHLFLEDGLVPLDPKLRVEETHPRHLVHHVHTQKEIAVTVHHNGLQHQTRFSPATTVRKVLAWASREFKISDHDGVEVFMAIPGSSVPLPDSVHIGRYVPHDQNKLALNVMTPARV